MANRSPSSADTARPRPVQVVLIEDDLTHRGLITTILDEANLSVEACPLGWEAHLCIRNTLPKVIILDVRMPDVDGIQLFYLLRADPRTKDIPVIFVTANPDQVRDELPNYEDMGAVLLPKPFLVKDLLELVRKALAT